MPTPALFKMLRDLIANDDLEAVLNHLRQVFEHTPQWDALLKRSAQFSAQQGAYRFVPTTYGFRTTTSGQKKHWGNKQPFKNTSTRPHAITSLSTKAP
jgi:hypothetical protein